MNFTLSKAELNSYLENIKTDSHVIPANRQPIHTLYGGAHLFHHDIIKRVSDIALKYFNTYAQDSSRLDYIFNRNDYKFSDELYKKVKHKLEQEPIEDYRIDFEDGYGYRKEEDADALRSAQEAKKACNLHPLPAYFGIRVKPLTKKSGARSLRTLDIFLTEFFHDNSNLPQNFIVTLPKVESTEQCSLFNEILTGFEKTFKLPKNYFKAELMVELPQAFYAPDGTFALPKLIAATGKRCFALHFGIYDFTSSIQIPAPDQFYMHPACDEVRFLMQIAGNTHPVHISDGATSFLPLEVYKSPASDDEIRRNFINIEKGWSEHFNHVLHSMKFGIFQGWDLHPAQIPARLIAMYYYFLKDKEKSIKRLKSFIEKAAQATHQGGVFDDAATGQGLLNFVLRGYYCNAFNEEDVLETGLSIEEIAGKSFEDIVNKRVD